MERLERLERLERMERRERLERLERLERMERLERSVSHVAHGSAHVALHTHQEEGVRTATKWSWVPGLIALAVFASPAAAQTPAAGESETVKALELKRFEAMEKNDLAALGELLSDELVYAHSSGAVDGKGPYLEALKTGKTRYKRMVADQLNVRIFGDTAVINGRARVSVDSGGQAIEGMLSFLDVWAKRNGRWQMVAWQSARMP
jgi:ketosteroid isomerase-like protein